jgi:hypothetical protein
LRRERHIEIDLAQGDRARHFGRDHLDEPDFGETLRAQQLLGDELRRIAQRRGFGESYTGGFRRALRRADRSREESEPPAAAAMPLMKSPLFMVTPSARV